MNEDYTPTTEEVRREYAPSGVPFHTEPGDFGWDEGIKQGEAEFNRWYEQQKAAWQAEARTAALREAADIVHEHRFDAAHTRGSILSKKLNAGVVAAESYIRTAILREGQQP